MQIALLGNLSAPYSTENELRRAWAALGHDVLCLQEGTVGYLDVPRLARGCDLFQWVHTHGLGQESTHPDQLEMLRGLRGMMPTVSTHLDRWHGLAREGQVYEPFFRTDIVFTADGGHDKQWEAVGVNHRWLPPGVAHYATHRGTARDEYRSDLAFVGSWQGYGHTEWVWRKQLVHWLQMTYGDRCRFWPQPGMPAVRGEDLNDLYASVKVLVGDSCLVGDARAYISDRCPESAGRGGVLVHPEVGGMDLVGEWGIAGTFPVGDLDAVHAAIERVLAWPEDRRDAFRDHAVGTVAARHTYVNRMTTVLETLTEEGWL